MKKIVLITGIIMGCVLLTGCGIGKTKTSDQEYIEELSQAYGESITSTLNNIGNENIPDDVPRGQAGHEDLEFAQSGEKGTIENPYSIGETVHLDKIFGWGDYIATQFSLDFTVEAKVTPDEYKEYGLVPSSNAYIEMMKCKYKISGDVSGALDSNSIPHIGLLTDKKYESDYGMLDEDFNNLFTIL